MCIQFIDDFIGGFMFKKQSVSCLYSAFSYRRLLAIYLAFNSSFIDSKHLPSTLKSQVEIVDQIRE